MNEGQGKFPRNFLDEPGTCASNMGRGGTDDVVYGQDGAKDLAKSDPDQAITNADSHEYFAENNPALS